MDLINNHLISNQVKDNDYLFEISWEVCNKVGGIHTVIVSKLKEIQKIFKKNYYAIGPYFKENSLEFEEIQPENKFLKIITRLENIGIKLHFGFWKTKNGKISNNQEDFTKVILIDFKDFTKYTNQIKKQIWDLYQIDSLNTSWFDWDQPIIFSWAVGRVIEIFEQEIINQDENIFVHSHEWMSGGSILYLNSLKEKRNRFKLIFTTHATILGRSLCANGEDLHNLEKRINPDDKAFEIGVHTKHQTEKVLANISDAFTTVSDITAKESEFFFKKKPDNILYNGFDNSTILDFDNLNQKYYHSRNRINNFIKGYFHQFYDLHMDNTQLFFISGRFEFKNKGIDILLDSIKLLNEKLIEKNEEKNIILFCLISMGKFNINQEVISSINNYNNNIKKDFELDFAPISTHEVPINNQIIKKLIELNLLNNKKDKIKIILIPEMLQGNENTFNFNYYDFIQGLDLGIFPSFYEPWGYTPLETISYAIPTITSDLTGFGIYLKDKVLKNNKISENIKPVKILERYKKNYQESLNQLVEIMYSFIIENKKSLYKQRELSKEIALYFDWEKFIKNYLNTYNQVLNNN